MIDTIEWWHAPPPWTCDGCAEPFSDLSHVELAALDGYDTDQSSELCPSCWPVVATWAHRDRVVTTARSIRDNEDGTVTLTDAYGQTVTEAFYGPDQAGALMTDEAEDYLERAALEHEEDDDEGGDDGHQPAR